MSYDARPEFDLQELVNEYGLGGVRSVRKPQGGAVNENWIVRTAKGTVVVRRVTKSRSLNDILFEHSFIRARSLSLSVAEAASHARRSLDRGDERQVPLAVRLY